MVDGFGVLLQRLVGRGCLEVRVSGRNGLISATCIAMRGGREQAAARPFHRQTGRP